MIKTTTLAEAMEREIVISRGFIEGSNEELVPRWILETFDGQVVPIFTPYTDNDSKDAIVGLIRMTLCIYQVTRYIYSSEAWVIMRDIDEVSRELETPSQANDRAEVLITTGETRDGMVLICHNRILPGRKLGEKVWFDEGQSAGRMTGLFKNLPQLDDETRRLGRQIIEKAFGFKINT